MLNLKSNNTLTAINYSEISMLCIDGSDAKNNEFVLDAISDSGYTLSGLQYIT